MVFVDPAEVALALSDIDRALPASQYSRRTSGASHPGLYSWWVNEQGRETLEGSLGADLPALIYAGQAGATSSRAMKISTATLGSRIVTNHLNGTAYGSTFRKSISALLISPLELRVQAPDRLVAEDRQRVSDWMREHLRVATYPFDDRAALGVLENDVLRILDPPLNLTGMPFTVARSSLSTLRRQLSHPQNIGV